MILVVLLLLALGSWLLRIALIVLVPASRLPAQVRAALDHLVPAVLASIIVVHLTQTLGTTPPALLPSTVATAGLLALVAWRTRNVPLTAGLALAVVLVLDLVVL